MSAVERRETDAPAETPGHGLDSGRVVSSVRWVAAGQVLNQGLGLTVSVILAHLLVPGDYGLVSMATVLTTLAATFSTLGFGPAIIQRQELSPALLRSVATLSLIVAGCLTLVIFAISEPLAEFYGEPGVRWVVTALGGTIALSAFGIVPDALLHRDLRFSVVVRIDAAVLVVSSIVAVSSAAAGLGPWALVAASLARSGLRSALLLATSSWRLSFGFDREAIRGITGFSASVTAFNLTQYLTRNTDRLIIGRALGATQLGLYDYAYRLYMFPLEAVVFLLINVLFPTFSRMQHDTAQLGRTFLRANGAIALVTFPMMAGLAALASPFVLVVLGEQWRPVIPLILALAPVGMVQSVTATAGQLFLARGRASLRTWWSVVYTSVMILSVFIGVRWGIVGVAVAYGVVMTPVFITSFWLALRLVDLGSTAIWRAVRAPFAASMAMGLAVAGLASGLESVGVPLTIVLGVGVAVGTALYAGLIRALAPEALHDVAMLLPVSLRASRAVRWLVPGAVPSPE